MHICNVPQHVCWVSAVAVTVTVTNNRLEISDKDQENHQCCSHITVGALQEGRALYTRALWRQYYMIRWCYMSKEVSNIVVQFFFYRCGQATELRKKVCTSRSRSWCIYWRAMKIIERIPEGKRAEVGVSELTEYAEQHDFVTLASVPCSDSGSEPNRSGL